MDEERANTVDVGHQDLVMNDSDNVILSMTSSAVVEVTLFSISPHSLTLSSATMSLCGTFVCCVRYGDLNLFFISWVDD